MSAENRTFARANNPISGEPIPGPRRLVQKRQLFPGLRGRLRVRLRYRDYHPNGSADRFGNINPIPFRHSGGQTL
jgi:hypothetical protein